jgi:hypothetical protein
MSTLAAEMRFLEVGKSHVTHFCERRGCRSAARFSNYTVIANY